MSEPVISTAIDQATLVNLIVEHAIDSLALDGVVVPDGLDSSVDFKIQFDPKAISATVLFRKPDAN